MGRDCCTCLIQTNSASWWSSKVGSESLLLEVALCRLNRRIIRARAITSTLHLLHPVGSSLLFASATLITVVTGFATTDFFACSFGITVSLLTGKRIGQSSSGCDKNSCPGCQLVVVEISRGPQPCVIILAI